MVLPPPFIAKIPIPPAGNVPNINNVQVPGQRQNAGTYLIQAVVAPPIYFEPKPPRGR